MKELQLNNFGVVEIKSKEMQETNGGYFQVLLVAVAFAICSDIAMNPSAHGSAAKAGWDAAGK